MFNWISSHNLIFPFPKLGKMGYCCFVHFRHKTLQTIGRKECHENMTCLPGHWKPKGFNLIHSYYYNSCMIPLNLASQQIIRQENMNVNSYFSLIFKLKMLSSSIHVQNLYKSIHKMNGPNFYWEGGYLCSLHVLKRMLPRPRSLVILGGHELCTNLYSLENKNLFPSGAPKDTAGKSSRCVLNT